MENKIQLKQATTPTDFLVAKKLIFEYAEWLAFDLSFQNFNEEINTLAETYGDKNGGLFIATKNGEAVGVAGIKRFNDKECEVKRMFVQADSRGFGIGKLLLTSCIELAKKLNYQMIKLDTAEYMKSAIKLYTDIGFIETPAYRYNPHEHARYFELDLKTNINRSII